MPSNVLPLHLKQTFLPIIWIFTKGEGDAIKSRLPFKTFSTLQDVKLKDIYWNTYSYILFSEVCMDCIQEQAIMAHVGYMKIRMLLLQKLFDPNLLCAWMPFGARLLNGPCGRTSVNFWGQTLKLVSKLKPNKECKHNEKKSFWDSNFFWKHWFKKS